MNAKELRELFSSSVVLFERLDLLHINFEEILRYGTFAGVSVGTKVETLALLLPEPDYIWEDDKLFASMKKKITKSMVQDFLTKGETFVKGFVSKKTGKPFDATVLLKDTDKYVNFDLQFKKKLKKCCERKIAYGKSKDTLL